MKTLYIISLFLIIALISCNDDFLERYPQDSLSNETYWNTENDLKLFINNIYADVIANAHYYGFYNGNGNWNPYPCFYASEVALDMWSDNMAPDKTYVQNIFTDIRTCKNVVRTSPRVFGWYWNILRNINFFLTNYYKATVSEGIKNKYAGEAKLFRAWFYWDKVKRFGDVPWINKVVNIDSPELTAAKDPRAVVMDSVLADINFAINWMPEDWTPKENPGRLNRWAALALKSRICLYEGTYRKYRGISDWETWLQHAADAAEEIINNANYSLFTTGEPTEDYWTLFTRSDLTGNPEIIHWKKYEPPINGHYVTGYTISWFGGFTKDLIDDYLCTDGLPIGMSPVYMGDDIIEDVFINRDPRMRQSVLHPDDPAKYLYNKDDQLSYPRLKGMTGGKPSVGGYHILKYYNRDHHSYGEDPMAGIIFRYGEVLLNYAEAKAELGTITQGDLDITINLLRDRVAMPHLNMSPPMDPKYSILGISSLIIEIRRERRIELLLEGYRYDDLIRWKLGENLAKRPLGMRWEDDNAAEERYKGNTVNRYTDPVTGKSYIDIYQGTAFDNIVWDDKYYLWPLPLNSLAQNPNLVQNPGW